MVQNARQGQALVRVVTRIGAEGEDDRIQLLLPKVKGKDMTELIASGGEKLASVPSGGVVPLERNLGGFLSMYIFCLNLDFPWQTVEIILENDHLSKIIAAYLLAILGGNTSPTDKDLKKILATGPREFTGVVNLISHFKLWPQHEFFCKNPLSIFDTHYLHNVVGNTESRKWKEMQLDQHASSLKETNLCIQPFDLNALREAFRLRETTPIEQPPSEKEIPIVAGKSKSESKDKEKKHKKHKDKDKEHKKHKHRHKDRCKDKDKEKKKDRTGHHDSGADLSSGWRT
ncbi:probable mediator of RNA polymerase II transcription subunit 19b [Capsicum annuum]|uniref:probable mediator of RNA polymerase II transcription subunit 19b n=1 Tax=Capsicum annuum TaxID=4072 RepID=UPI001FB14A6B|nr:probable mediator of RNA polymerase II transcription subunit 19b [Capsicum annuum]